MKKCVILILSSLLVLVYLGWSDEVDAMSYVQSGLLPQKWAVSKGLRWLELKSGDVWTFSLKEKDVHRILLVCERPLEPDAPAGTQPYVLLGVQLQTKEDVLAEQRKSIPGALQL